MTGCAELVAPADSVSELKATLIEMVRHADRTTARSMQRAIGPSEVGDECMRRIAYTLLGSARANTMTDPWFAIIGSSVHDWLAHAIDKWDAAHGRIKTDERRYLVEHRVTANAAGIDVSGTCDLFDVETGTIIDHKIVGPTALKTYRSSGPSNRYRTQVHVYGLGMEQQGRTVTTVALAFFPRNGYLDDLYVWQEPYRRDVAEAALSRVASIGTMTSALGASWAAAIPAVAGSGCVYCPFYAPHIDLPDGTGCPGR